ncbi:hypothetical protein [Thermococcus nautili]|uniref:Uncharacterized protein n=1 Tax=Thermococcus nautili TaxID=195522 RepID=W8P0Z9_9EURY|nr:hypothetical protein [Thermococcus nautili]AHL22406.1 hypothetical protein BD01_0784 [Thermococcus nautili]
MKRKTLRFFLLILLLALISGSIFIAKTKKNEKGQCFSRVPINVSNAKPPMVVGPSFPPGAGFKGITLDEVVNGSPRHVLIGFFNFRPSNWTDERPQCYFKALEGYSENWTGFIMSGVALSNVTLSGRVYLAVYVYPLEGTAIIAKVDYGETPEKSKITEAFRLDYEKNPSEIVDAYISKLEHSGHTAVKELSGGLSKGWVFKKGGDYLLVIETRDAGNLYLILALGGEDDVKKLADSIFPR